MTKGILVGLNLLLIAVMIGFGIFQFSNGRSDKGEMMVIGAVLAAVMLVFNLRQFKKDDTDQK
jgi:hypothetical protein